MTYRELSRRLGPPLLIAWSAFNVGMLGGRLVNGVGTRLTWTFFFAFLVLMAGLLYAQFREEVAGQRSGATAPDAARLARGAGRLTD
jgi:hypothetical protein